MIITGDQLANMKFSTMIYTNITTFMNIFRGGVGRKKRMRKSRDSVFKEGINKMAGQPLTE